MHHRTGEKPTPSLIPANLVTLFVFTLALGAGVVFPGLTGHDAANAAACAACHSDGRTGSAPATPTHIRMGLASSPNAGAGANSTAKPAAPQPSKPAATPVAAPAKPTPKPGAGNVTVMDGVKATNPPARQLAGTAKAGASRVRTAASGNSASCTQCHQDGRKGITPPGHPSVSGMFGNGTAPPPKGKAGGRAGKSLAAGGKGKNSAGGLAGKGRREAEDREDREESRGGHEREDD
jgi:cytochrome c553